MNWRDLLYFSRGERRALTLLLCLIAASWIILLLTDEKTDYTPVNNNRLSEPEKTAQNIPVNSPEPEKVKTPTPGRKTIPPERKINFIREKPQIHPKEGLFLKQKKYPVGTVVELNTADTTILKKSSRDRKHFCPPDH